MPRFRDEDMPELRLVELLPWDHATQLFSSNLQAKRLCKAQGKTMATFKVRLCFESHSRHLLVTKKTPSGSKYSEVISLNCLLLGSLTNHLMRLIFPFSFS